MLNLESVECQTWHLNVDSTAAWVRSETNGVDDLSGYTLSQARDIACDILAKAHYLDLPEALATAKARQCLELLEGGCLGKTSPEYWLTSKNRGLIIGAYTVDSCAITCLAVLPKFRNLGLGETLVRSLVSRFARDGQTIIEVAVDSRASAAIAIYRRIGFTLRDEHCESCCCS